jgi:eukaryotic-like serine/threonine-protein kinase
MTAQPQPSDRAAAAADEDLSPLGQLVAAAAARLESEGDAAVDALCREHPEHADALRERLAALRDMGLLARGRIGPYVLLRTLGRGGMGIVHLARDSRDGRMVALKALPSRLAASPRALERFRREVRAVAALDHENIVPVLDSGEENGVPWFAMAWIEGRTLAEVLDGLRALRLAAARLDSTHLSTASAGRPPPARGTAYVEAAVRLALDVAEALRHAHEHGVIHRDVKPSNILVRQDGRALLFDFGLARLEDEQQLTLTGDFTGTPAYVSPEQIAGPRGGVDGRSDVFSLGVTLYELLTLQRPFEAPTAAATLQRVARRDPTPPRRVNAQIPRDLETVVLCALEKSPARRYGSAAELAQDLRHFLELRPVLARPVPAPLRAVRALRREPPLAAAAALAALIVVGVPLGLALANHRISEQAALAQRAADRRERLNDFLLRMASAPDPAVQGEDVTVRDWLERSGAALTTELADDPLAAADLRQMIANTWLNLGEPARAESQARAAANLLRGRPGAEGELAESLNLLGVALTRQQRLDDSDAALREALALDRRAGERSGPVARELCNLAANVGLRGQPAQAVPLFRDVLERRRELYGQTRTVVAESQVDLAVALLDSGGDAAEAERLLTDAAALQRRLLPAEDPALATTLHDLSLAKVARGDAAGALAAETEAFELLRRRCGDAHPSTARSAAALAILLARGGQWDEAARHAALAEPVLAAAGEAEAANLAQLRAAMAARP